MSSAAATIAGYILIVFGAGILVGLGLARLGTETDVLDVRRESRE